jgi:hypothetical protein
LDDVRSVLIKEWQFAQGFNQTASGYKLEVTFDEELQSIITY